jgi:hypothetical protein
MHLKYVHKAQKHALLKEGQQKISKKCAQGRSSEHFSQYFPRVIERVNGFLKVCKKEG